MAEERRWQQGMTRLRQGYAIQNRDQPADSTWWNAEPSLARVADGLPGAVDQRRAFGNAIVPQVAAQFITSFYEATLIA